MRKWTTRNLGKHLIHRGRTYIESDKMTSSGPMESADQTAWAGVVPVQPWLYWRDTPPEQSDQLSPWAQMTSSCRSLCTVCPSSMVTPVQPQEIGCTGEKPRLCSLVSCVLLAQI